jgi:hypothetical protein
MTNCRPSCKKRHWTWLPIKKETEKAKKKGSVASVEKNGIEKFFAKLRIFFWTSVTRFNDF